MTLSEVQTSLFNHFETVNDTGSKIVKDDNVSYPNKTFTQPTDNRFFILSCLFNEPESIGNFDESQDIVSGILQINICIPLNAGETEADSKFNRLCKIFKKGTVIDDEITVTSTPSKTVQYSDDYYSLIMRINWETII